MLNRIWILFFIGLCLCGGCDQKDQTPRKAKGSLRVVTLAPAVSRMLIDLSLADAVVGVSDYDATAIGHLPVVGNYLDINSERVLALNPTHVIMMTGRHGKPSHLVQLAQTGQFQLLAYDYPDTIAAVGEIVLGLGRDLGYADRAAKLHKAMFAKLTRLEQKTDGQPRLRVLPVIGVDPVMASGPGTVIDELVTLCGGINVAGDARVSAPTFDREKLIALRPEVILLCLPGAPVLTKDGDDPRLADFAGLPIPAVLNHRIVLINDPLVFLPATSLPRIAQAITQAIHPELQTQIKKNDAGP